MLSRKVLMYLSLICLICFPVQAAAETIVLKSGETVDGDIVEDGYDYIRLRDKLYGFLYIYNKDDIEKIIEPESVYQSDENEDAGIKTIDAVPFGPDEIDSLKEKVADQIDFINKSTFTRVENAAKMIAGSLSEEDKGELADLQSFLGGGLSIDPTQDQIKSILHTEYSVLESLSAEEKEQLKGYLESMRNSLDNSY